MTITALRPDGGRPSFYKLWLRRAFHKPSWVEYVTTVYGLASILAGRRWPDDPFLDYLWQAPFWGFGLLGLMRVATAPYEIWQEQNRRISALRKLAGEGEDDLRHRFQSAIAELRLVASAREMWWSENHRRDGGRSEFHDRIIRAIDDLRQFFPPDFESQPREDPITALHTALIHVGDALGYGWEGERLERERNEFSRQLDALIARFDRQQTEA